MLAALYRRPGPAAEVLSVEDVPAPQPGPGEVRVRVAVSGVNPTDWKQRAGSAVPFAFQVPDQDGSGVVDAVGEGVDPARVGERAWVYFASWKRQWGTAAQHCVVPEAHAVALPEGTSHEVGASLGIPALTAHRCLFADGPVDGRTVLVAGGAGAVGHAAIELARWRGARVIATVSGPEKAALARAAGAHEVVDYRAQDAAAEILRLAPEGVDRVVEVALHQNAALDSAVCGPHAAIAAYANGGSTRLAAGELMGRNVTVRFVLVYTMPRDALDLAVGEVTQALREDVLSTLPVHRFPLEQIADAHDAVQAGAVGKVVVDVP